MHHFKNYYSSIGLLILLLLSNLYVQAQGKALHFDGVNDHVAVPQKSTVVSGSFTVMAWVKPENATKAMHIFNTRETTEFGFDMQLTGGNKIHADIGTGSQFITTAADANFNYSVGRWLHVAYTVTSGTYKIYANGKLLINGTMGAGTPLLLNATHKIIIGKNSNENTYFQGAIDEVKVYNTVLSEADIKADMLSATATVPANLVAHYNFEQTGSNLTDVSGNGYDGMLTNFALTGTSSNWVEGYAMVVPVVAAASNISVSSFTANWTAPLYNVVDNYVVDVAKDSDFTNVVSGSPFSVTGLAIPITGLSSGTDYYYRVSAQKTTGIAQKGAYSAVTKVTTALAFDYLNALSFNDLNFSPSFSATQFTYTAVTANTNFQLMSVQPNASSMIEIKMNGGSFSTLASGVLSPVISLNFGVNTLEVKVTDGSVSRTYIFTINQINPAIRYVTQNGAGSKDGSSWVNASDDLQLMINESASHDMIWVAQGTYKPIRAFDNLSQINLKNRINAFVLKSDVKVYGGFAGIETALAERNYVQNKTVLSGDFDDNDVVVGERNALTLTNLDENVYHVIFSMGAVGQALLDGFTIKGGNANGGIIWMGSELLSHGSGGGLYLYQSSPTLSNLNIIANNAFLGGGVFAEESQAIMENMTISYNSATAGGGVEIALAGPTLNNSTISYNRALNNGGGMINLEASTTITNTKFFKNGAVNNGGAIYNTDASPTFINVDITENVTNDYGGGISNRNNATPQLTNVLIAANVAHMGAGILNAETSSSTLTNVTITGNTALTMAGAIENNLSSTSIIRNSIIWGNNSPNNKGVRNGNNPALISYSLIEGGYTGTGNIAADPMFKNANKQDYHLQYLSSAINAGSDSYYATGQTPNLTQITKDLNGGLRKSGSAVDMGAYEAEELIAALSFDGIDDKVSFNTSHTVSGAFTVQAWVRPTDFTKTMHVLSTKFAGGYGFDLQLKQGNILHANIGSANAWLSSTADASYDYSAGRWMHIAYSVTATGYQIYVNGSLKQSGTFSGTPLFMDANHLLQLGYSGTENTYFKGDMDEVRIYSKALSEQEINKEMTSLTSALPLYLVAHYNFDQGVPSVNNTTKNVLENQAIYALNGTLSGFDLNGNTSNWIESYATVLPEVAVPTNLSPSSFEARWAYPQLGIVDNGYVLEVATDPAFTAPVAGSPFIATAQSKVITGLAANTTYYYRVAADKQSVTGKGAFSPTMSTTLQTFSPPGNALNFDGADNHVVIQPQATVVKGDFTVMAWVKPEHATKAMHILSTREGGDNTFDMQLTGGNKIHGDIGTGSSWNTNTADAAYKYNINQWLHVAYVVSPTGYKIYANGKEVGSGTLTAESVLLDATHYITIGKNATEPTYFKGSIDEVRIYSEALSEAAIKLNMLNSTISHPLALVAHYNFDQAVNSKSDVLKDQGVNAYDGVLKGFALTGTTGNWVESYAMVVPTLNAATNIKSSKFTANWTAPLLGIVDHGYFLEVATDDAFTQMISNSPFQLNDTQQEITGLNTGTTYYYRVRADKNSLTGQGAVSEVKTASPSKENQTITFAALDPKNTNNLDFLLNATSSSGLAISYTSSDLTVAEVYQDITDGNRWKVKIKGAGTTEISAKQAGDADFNVATDVVQTLVVIEAVLPVTLSSYTAKLVNQTARLDWVLSAEQNNNKFVIYRSGDDKNFLPLGEVSSLGNTTSIRNYSFVDKQPLNGNNYYQLVQLDHNGQTTNLGTRLVTYNLAIVNYNVYPNPTKGKVNLHFAAEYYDELEVLDAIGKLRQKHPLSNSMTTYIIHLDDYPAGLYFIRLHSAKGTVFVKVMKY